jgi:transcription termination factor Rho
MQEMKLTEFKNKKPPELIAYAESLEVENPASCASRRCSRS